MPSIGFKTEKMKSAERMPALIGPQERLSQEQRADVVLQMRVRQKAILLVDEFLQRGLLIDYVKGQLEDLRRLYQLTEK